MASIGSFPFVIGTKTESLVLLHGKSQNRPRIRCRAKKFENLSVLSKGVSVRLMAVRATSKDGGESSDDALQATIEKSKKVLAMQRDLLQQISERKKLVSSIKSSIINPEEEGTLKETKSSIISPEEEGTSKETKSSTINPEEEKGASNNQRDIKTSSNSSDDSGASYEQIKKSPTHSGRAPSSPKKTLEQQSKMKISSYRRDEELETVSSDVGKSYEVENDLDQNKPLKLGSFSKNSTNDLKETTAENVWSEELPSFLSNTSKTSTINDVKYEDSTESALPDINNVENDKETEEAPPPLAGVNVMNVILVAAECAPFVKTGGLGDVAGSLPKALARRGHRVMVVVPRYSDYKEAQETGIRRRYKVDGQDMEINYFQAYIDGVDFVFIDSPIFRHLDGNVYGGNRMDILKRMILFCKAAIEVPWYVPCGGVCYGDGNLVFIANDWHTALLPVYLKACYRDNGLMKYTRSVLVIHNIAHQGRGPVDDFSYVDLPEHYIDLFKLYDPVGGDHFNIFAAGLKTADRVVTVSHGYAWEVKTSEGGWGLHNIINENDWKLRGIVNGIDTKEWNPKYDVYLQTDGYTNYSLETLNSGKAQCKAALQRELGLPIRPDVPLIGFIGRLDPQKGVDLIAEAIPWMMGQDVQLVMLGTGRPDLEQMLRQIESQHHEKIRGWVGFSVKTSHRITAGADILLMPSRFEPCGLNQLYAMMYGTVPVVHAVGGLRDTVQPFDPFNETGIGWTFDRAEANKLIDALGNCLLTYRQYKESWEGLQKRGMSQDLTWDNAAEKYEEVLIAAKYQW